LLRIWLLVTSFEGDVYVDKLESEWRKNKLEIIFKMEKLLLNSLGSVATCKNSKCKTNFELYAHKMQTYNVKWRF